MKIAAIDLGSNSIHMVIVEVTGSGGFQVIDRETEMVRLGASTLMTGSIPPAAARKALGVLETYRRLAKTHCVDEVLAVATSAIREADNGEEFLQRVGRKIGVWPRAIAGEEEARLVYLAVLNSVNLGARRALVIDIGGGSVELALGAGGRVEEEASAKLGVLRLSERFVGSDPLSVRDEGRIEQHVKKKLDACLKRIRRSGFDLVVGTSGTILALGRLAAEYETGRPAGRLHHITVRSSTIRSIRRQLTALDLRARRKTPGLDRRRADIIVAGAVVLDTILSRLKVKKLILCDWALREGILLDYILNHPRQLRRADEVPDVRRRSVLELAERCLTDADHSRHVASLALSLFDGTRGLHRLGDDDRVLLEYASLLHDVGHHISHRGHHRHSYYLIRNGGLRGFDPLEIEQIASVARYHRSGNPRRRNPVLAGLPPSLRRGVRTLSGILRLADGLDRGHRQRIRSVSATSRGKRITVRCRAAGDAELEIWGARKRAELLEAVLGRPIRLAITRDRRAGRTEART